jgi:hypothetical protein
MPPKLSYTMLMAASFQIKNVKRKLKAKSDDKMSD